MNNSEGIPDNLQKILNDHFEYSKSPEETLEALKNVVSSYDLIDEKEFNAVLHNLYLCMNASKYYKQFNDDTKIMLKQYLKKAAQENDKIWVQNILPVYKSLFGKVPANDELESRVNSFFDNLVNNNNIHKDLETAVESKTLALIIGSGLTAEYVGTWDKLLTRLMVMRCYSTLLNDAETVSPDTANIKKMKEYMDNHIKTFINDNVNYLERGEYLRFDSDDRTKQIGTSAEDLYREKFFAAQVQSTIFNMSEETDATRDIIHIEKTFKKEWFEDKNKKLGTLAAIIRLCINKNITEIITYNFDTIFDRLVADKDIRECFGDSKKNIRVEVYSYADDKPVLVFPKKARKSWKTIKIYHVHGILDRNIKEINPIIFSEYSYQNYQDTTLNWSNLRLADIQSKYDVLCVGFSGEDPNFRSLRRFLNETNANPIMGNKREKNKLFLMRDYSADKSKLLDTEIESDENDYAMACIKTYFDMVTSYFKKQYNVDIVWTNGFDDMADQINTIADIC